MKNSHILKIVYSAVFAALIFIGTQFIQIPLPFGYFNLGDCFVLLSAVIIGGPYAIVASAIGAAMADVLSGYVVYAPATLLIKSLMVVVMIIISKFCDNRRKKNKMTLLTIAAVCAEMVMILGYFIYDTIIYTFAGAVATLSGNILQACIAVCISVLILAVFEHSKLLKHIKLS